MRIYSGRAMEALLYSSPYALKIRQEIRVYSCALPICFMLALHLGFTKDCTCCMQLKGCMTLLTSKRRWQALVSSPQVLALGTTCK